MLIDRFPLHYLRREVEETLVLVLAWCNAASPVYSKTGMVPDGVKYPHLIARRDDALL